MGEAGASTAGISVDRVLVPVGNGANSSFSCLKIGGLKNLSLFIDGVQGALRIGCVKDRVVSFILFLAANGSYFAVGYLCRKGTDPIFDVNGSDFTISLANQDEPVVHSDGRDIPVKILGRYSFKLGHVVVLLERCCLVCF